MSFLPTTKSAAWRGRRWPGAFHAGRVEVIEIATAQDLDVAPELRLLKRVQSNAATVLKRWNASHIARVYRGT